ncbi:armadillo-type protein [Russula aff. rugulosa BPL654]|nr:armadillo-type protein [Russula aff. rugulosa BPL654]
MAEVWGSLLRRLRASKREAAVEVMASDLGGVEEACTWAYIFACKSVSQTLHTATPSIVAPLLQIHLMSREPAITYTCLRRLLTALIHHCRGAEQFLPVSELLVERFINLSRSLIPDEDTDCLGRSIEIISVVSSVRQGSRLTGALLFISDQLSSITAVLPSLIRFSSFEKSLLRACVSVLMAGDLSLWMAAGRDLVQQSWTNVTFGAQLCGILSDLSWGGWKMLEFPHMIQQLPNLLDRDATRGLGLLAALHNAQRVKDVPAAWLLRLEEWILKRFEAWTLTAEKVEELRHVLQVNSLLPGTLSVTCGIINNLLDAPDPETSYKSDPVNPSWVLGSCLKTLANCPHDEWKHHADLIVWTEKVLQRWLWSEIVLDGLSEVLRRSPEHAQKMSFEDMYRHLAFLVSSHSRPSRLNALYLLSSPLVDVRPTRELVLSRLLQAEDVPIDVRGSRERVLRVTQLERVIPADDAVVSDLAVRWLVAQLKVGLRPVWLPTAHALETLSERCGEIVWRVMFGELKAVTALSSIDSVPNWAKDMGIGVGNAEEWRESERSWRDPSAHKICNALSKWCMDGTFRVLLIRDQLPQDRFDRLTFEAQLLVALKHNSSLVERHNRDLIPLFLNQASPLGPAKLPRTKLAAWFSLFSNFTNPRYLYLLPFFPDRSLQGLALSCLCTYKPPYLLPHADRLRGLLDESRWRDELAQLDIANISGEERPTLVDAVVRLLFGFVRERRTRDRRGTVLAALGGCTDSELYLLVKLMLQDVLPAALETTDVGVIPSVASDASLKQQIGFLHLLGDVLKQLGTRLTSRWHALISATISLTSHAQGSLEALRQDNKDPDPEGDIELLPEEVEETDLQASSPKQLRTVRQLGIRRFTDFFRISVPFNFEPYMKEAFRALLSPRLASLPRENTQAPSGLLDLLFVWSSDERYATFLVDYDERVLPQVYGCLTAPGVKPTVISRILDIVDLHEDIQQRAIRPHVTILLTNLSTLVQDTKVDVVASNQLAQRQISILSGLSHYLEDGTQASTLLKLFFPLLRKPTKHVGERVKADILKIMANLFPLIPDLSEPSTSAHKLTFELVSSLFQSVRSRQCRVALIAAFNALSSIDVSLRDLAELLEQLNAYSTKRIEEPDFDRRLEAFSKLNETLHTSLTPPQWLPILYNLLHFIQSPNELAIRRNSSQGFKNFVDAVVVGSDPEYQTIFMRRLLPGLKNGLRSKNEMVRSDVLGVIAYAVSRCDNITTLQDMKVLLEGGDEEANFFNNIYHVQLHRRIRALNRLSDHCDASQLRSSTLADIFVPLVGNFITPASHTDHHLVTAAIVSTGRMARHLSWGPYYALVQQYLKMAGTKDSSERLYIRTIVAILDSFHFPMDEIAVPQSSGELDAVEPEDANEEQSPPDPTPTSSRISDAVNHRLLPALIRHLENRNEAEDALRIPVSIGIAKIALHLPGVIREAQVTKLVTVLSQVLRSKSSETRDITRDALCKICIVIEMRGALFRGPQLHVLAYVTHALLVHVTKPENVETFKRLDNCVEDVTHISAEDVQSEDFKTKMREVRSSGSKGLDSLAIIARFITPSKISSLLRPLRAVMQETETLKVMVKVDDVLRRLSSGLNSNEHLGPKELLVLCHTLISQNSKFQKNPMKASQKRKRVKGHAIVEIKRDPVLFEDHYAVNSFRFIAFGLDLFNTAFRRNRFDFGDPEVLARLESMVPVIGNTLYASNSHVLIQGLKASMAIIKCPLKELETSVPVFVRQTIDILKEIGSTESEVAQTALKSLAVIVRDKANAEVKEKDLVYLLELLAPDLEEPGRQASVFAILRAIVARKFIVPEIYDLMDRVSEIMVTNQSPQVQELCRSVLLQFLLDYPQGKGRLRTTMAFLAKNTAFMYESGRISVLELLSAIVSKFEESLIGDYADLLFVALVMVIANDDSAKSREMASEIIKSLFLRLDLEHRRLLVSHLRSWASQTENPQLTRVAVQVYGIMLDALQADASIYLPSIIDDLNLNISRSVEQLTKEEEDQLDVDSQWQVVYHIFTVLGKLFSMLLVAGPPKEGYPTTSPLAGLKLEDIAGKHCTQLKSSRLSSALGLQIVKNLFYIGKCFWGERTEEANGDNPLAWLFSKLSYQLRSAYIARRSRSADCENWHEQPAAILRFFAAMANHMEATLLQEFLMHILSPIYRITEDDTIREQQMDELKATAIELQDLVQQKVGTTKFAVTYNKIRQTVLGYSQVARYLTVILQFATNPEAAARRKQQRSVAKKESRKRKSTTFADNRGRLKRHKD